jgi:hypothetical protein
MYGLQVHHDGVIAIVTTNSTTNQAMEHRIKRHDETPLVEAIQLINPILEIIATKDLRHRVPTITDQLRAVADHHQLEAPQAVGLQEVAHHEGDNLNNQKHEVHRNN